MFYLNNNEATENKEMQHLFFFFFCVQEIFFFVRVCVKNRDLKTSLDNNRLMFILFVAKGCKRQFSTIQTTKKKCHVSFFCGNLTRRRALHSAREKTLRLIFTLFIFLKNAINAHNKTIYI